MSVNFQQIAPIIAACLTSGGVIFQIGKHAEKLDIIGLKVEAQEKKDAIRQLGARLIEVDAVPYSDPNNYVKYSKIVAEKIRKESGKLT
jgi:cysteine synthase A